MYVYIHTYTYIYIYIHSAPSSRPSADAKPVA